MKYFSLTKFIFTLLLFFSISSQMVASDTLTVYASGPGLDEIINNDTTADGMQVHKVYKLVSLDTTYLYFSPITVKSDLTIIGVLGTDGRPPCIQPGLRSDNSLSANFINMTGEGTKGVFKDFYLLGLSIDGSFTGSKDFFISGDNIKFYMDNVIIDENHYEAIAFNAKGVSLFITNCKFRNSVHPTNWFGSSSVAVDYPSNTPADTIIMKYNTFLCVNSRAATTGNDGIVKYFEFSHNTYVYNVTEDLRMFSVVAGKFNYNIFYSLYAGAQPVSQFPWWFQVFSADINSLIDFDTLTTAMDSVFDPGSIGNPNARMLAEAKRNIEVKGNLYFWPTALTDFWTNWNSTHSGGDSLITPIWMNNRTQNMFNDDEHWPNLDESDNINVDPQFGSSIKAVLTNAEGTPGVYGLLEYVTDIRSGNATTNVWGYKPQVVEGDYWIPEWPLPEQVTGDLKYSAPITAPDGNPYGDPYWFTLQTTPKDLEVLSTNNSYTVSASPSDNYPDTGNKKLTDNKFASKAYYADPQWVGFPSPGVLEVVIDLGQNRPIKQFMAEYLLDPHPAIFLPQKVSVSVSTDNTTFSDIGLLRDSAPNDTLSSIHKYYYTLSNSVDARYVKFSTTSPSGAWIFVDEYQALGSVITDVQEQSNSLPKEFRLSNNYPNPFNPTTVINFTIPKTSDVTLNVYNVLGQKVTTLINEQKNAGSYKVTFDASELTSGVYIYRIKAGNFVSTKKMVLLK